MFVFNYSLVTLERNKEEQFKCRKEMYRQQKSSYKEIDTIKVVKKCIQFLIYVTIKSYTYFCNFDSIDLFALDSNSKEMS